MTVYRELGELADRMAKVMTLYWQCYHGPLTGGEESRKILINKLETEVELLCHDLRAVFHNLKETFK